MATSNNISKALSILNSFDWYWRYDDGYGICAKARNSMLTFVELASQCEATVCNALRNLWIATYDYYRDNISQEAYNEKKAELMSVINA